MLFLPVGDAALTRRAKKPSTLSAVVLKWSRARKRYERQGLLMEEDALAQAEQECFAQFGVRVREPFPHCPPGRETLIAEHACQKYSGRVGRSASAKQLNEKAVRLAVCAHIQHTETNYDQLLQGLARQAARAKVERKIGQVVAATE